jgi:APA family basic amino acid/polyamine antiporter
MSGGIAAMAVAFGEYLGSFLPWFSTQHVLLEVPISAWKWTLSGGQVAAVLAILVLTAVNHLGLKEGAWTQNALTVLKIGSIVAFGILGLYVPAKVAPDLYGPVSAVPGSLLGAFGVAMIASLWTYDGWYGLTCSAGEVRNPGKNLPRGLILGTALVIGLYMLMNLAYIRALTPAEMAATPRIAETAASALFGPAGARLISLAVLVSTFGCLSATILYSSRIYLPMAEDGLFFRSLARVHPRYRTPVPSLWAQSAWSMLLALSGSYSQLYTYAVFAALVFNAMPAAAVFVLRRTRPDHPRPYRAWGYPVVPMLFILASLLLIGNTLKASPVESFAGLGLVALGLPAYWMFRRRNASSQA